MSERGCGMTPWTAFDVACHTDSESLDASITNSDLQKSEFFTLKTRLQVILYYKEHENKKYAVYCVRYS